MTQAVKKPSFFDGETRLLKFFRRRVGECIFNRKSKICSFENAIFAAHVAKND